MKSFAVVTIFPELFHAYFGMSIMKRAADKGLVRFGVFNQRDFAEGRHKVVDDYPYGGGPGMVLKPEPLLRAVEHVKSDGVPTRVILMSPQGRVFTQAEAKGLAINSGRLLFLAGRYEGVDERVLSLVDDELSIGDYVLTGGELPALVIIDAVVRLIPGALGDEESSAEESFQAGTLDFPHYTRPAEWMGMKVPEALLSGNHAEIARWRRKQALKRTLARRPELLEKETLSAQDMKLLKEIKEEEYGHD